MTFLIWTRCSGSRDDEEVVRVKAAVFAALLAISAALVSAGFWMMAPPAGLIVAGVALAVWSWLLLAGDPVDQVDDDVLEVSG